MCEITDPVAVGFDNILYFVPKLVTQPVRTRAGTARGTDRASARETTPTGPRTTAPSSVASAAPTPTTLLVVAASLLAVQQVHFVLFVSLTLLFVSLSVCLSVCLFVFL